VPDPVVLSELRGAVVLLTLNRPDRLNGWTDEMERLYFRALAAADADPHVRAIVVTGAGRGFCAGADMGDLEDFGSGAAEYEAQDRPKTFPLQIRKPLIAAINGACAGLGLIQALYCDVRFVAGDAKLTTSFSRRGLIAEHGISWVLPRLIGAGRALDLLLSARVVSGHEAVALGLAAEAVPREDVLDRALQYAADLAENCSPYAMAVTKQLVHTHLAIDLDAALAEANVHMAQSLARPDLAEGVASFLDKSPPSFPPLA
jgi:enoyl-CoA hydratase/carnithine racemase